MNVKAIVYALASAALFGLSTPAAKALLGSLHPVALAGLLYCGAGIGAALLQRTTLVGSEASLTRAQIPYLGGAIVSGGVVGPVLLMVGLAQTKAATASLLLSLEGVATALLAWYVFRESFDRRSALGMVCLVSGGLVLAWSGQPELSDSSGSARDPGRLHRVGSRQQPDAQGLTGRSASDCGVQGPVGRASQPCAGHLGCRVVAGAFSRPGRRTGGCLGLWREPCAVHRGAPPSRRGEDRRLFFDRAVHWGLGGDRVSQRARDSPALGGGRADGARCLATCHRAARS